MMESSVPSGFLSRLRGFFIGAHTPDVPKQEPAAAALQTQAQREERREAHRRERAAHAHAQVTHLLHRAALPATIILPEHSHKMWAPEPGEPVSNEQEDHFSPDLTEEEGQESSQSPSIPVPSAPSAVPAVSREASVPAAKSPVAKHRFFASLRSIFVRFRPVRKSKAMPPVAVGDVVADSASLPGANEGSATELDALLTPGAAAPPQSLMNEVALSEGRILRATEEQPLIRKEAPDLGGATLLTKEAPPPTAEQLTAAKADEEARLEVAEHKRKEEAEARKHALEEAKKKAPATFKIPLKRKVSSFAAFLDSLKYFGQGKEKFLIIENLATMLDAGLPLIDSIRTLEMEANTKAMKQLLHRITLSVENGIPLWRAMDQEHFFTPHAIALIRIGEEAGNLAENMEYLAAQQEKDQALISKVKMAMIYPIIVLSLMFIIVMGLGMFVLPNLIQVLYSLNVPLPFVTRMVILFTSLFSKYGAIGVPSIIGGAVLLAVLGKTTRLKVVFQWMLFRIPGIGKLMWEATIARFGVIVGGLLQAGVPLVDALKSLVEVTPIESYRAFYAHLLEHVSVGDSFAKSFLALKGSQKLLPVSVQQLVMTGERTGSLSKIMLKVADIYERKANDTAQKLPTILEPMLLLFIGGLVGTIALSIIVPIYSIVGNISH